MTVSKLIFLFAFLSISAMVKSGSKYKKMEYGNFCSGSWARITNEEICKDAASALNLKWGESWDGPGDFPGCLHTKDSRNMVYFNTSPNPSNNPNNNNYAEICQTEDCVNPETAGSDYTGTVNVTESGLTCQKWSAQEPQSHTAGVEIGDINFCRNPDNGETVWCYTIDPDTRWQYCDVPLCDSTNTTTTSSITTTASIDHTTKGFLLLGGSDGGKDSDNVEAYGSNLSLPSLPNLPLPLGRPIAEMTESGAVYVAGGYTSNAKTFMLSSLSSSKWEELEARMPIPVATAGSVVVGEIILVLGGWTGSDRSDGIQMFDTSKSLPTWELLSQSKLPEPLDMHSGAVFEGHVILMTSKGVTYTTSVSSIISDTQLDWEEEKLPDVQGYMYGPSIEVVEDKLVTVHLNKVFTKNTMDSQWVQLKPLPRKKKYYPSIGSVQGNIVIGGGEDGHKRHSSAIYFGIVASATVFMWMEASSQWEEVNSLKIPRGYHATVQLPKDL